MVNIFPIFGLLFCILAFYIMIRVYKEFLIAQFIAIGIAFLGFIPLTWFVFLLLNYKGKEYENLLGYLFPVILGFTAIFFILLFMSILRLMDNEFRIFHGILYALSLWVAGAFFVISRLYWNNSESKYELYSNPNWMLALYAGLMVIITTLTFSQFSNIPKIRSEFTYLIKLGGIAEAIGLVIGIWEYYNQLIGVFIFLMDLGNLCLAYAIMKNPYVFYPEDVRVSKLIIRKLEDGSESVQTISFEEEFLPEDDFKTELLPTILRIISQAFKQENLPNQISFLNNYLLIEEINDLIAILITNKIVLPLRNALKKVLEMENFDELDHNKIFDLFEFSI